jgi:hypothetical protein
VLPFRAISAIILSILCLVDRMIHRWPKTHRMSDQEWRVIRYHRGGYEQDQ